MTQLSNATCRGCGRAPATEGTYSGNFCETCAAAVPLACDFCTLKAPVWVYPCGDFVVGAAPADDGSTHVHWSRGPWAACDDCHALIERGDWPALAERSVSAMYAPDAFAASALRDGCLDLHARFDAHRRGPCVAVTAPGGA